MSAKAKEIPPPVEKYADYNPCMVVICGPSLSGKTTASSNIARMSNLTMLDVDDFRSKLVITMGGDPAIRKDMPAEIRIQAAAYRMMHVVARMHIGRGEPVVLSASYSQPRYREHLQRFQEMLGVPLRVFRLDCPEEAIDDRLRSRLAQNDSASTIKDRNQAMQHRQHFQPINELPFVSIETNTSREHVAMSIFSHLQDLKKTKKAT